VAVSAALCVIPLTATICVRTALDSLKMAALAGLPHKGHEAAQSGEAGTVDWSRLISVIKSTDWSAHQMYVEHVSHWDVLSIGAAIDES
jgi:hypothetical protein